MLVRDAIHDYIELDDDFSSLVDTPKLQRLRWIRQLGTSYLVYPGANHTRFEHSLGTYHLASRLSKYLGLSREDDLTVRAAALLHDIGHGPLSHVSEEVSLNTNGMTHEDIGCGIIKNGEIREILERMGVDPEELCSAIRGEGKHGVMISGEIDLDRMDYLSRDSYYTGVTNGVDLGRLLVTLRMVDDAMVISENGLAAAEGLLVSRFLMYPTVYFHHTCRIAELMLVRGIESLIEDGMRIGEIMAMDDIELISAMEMAKGLPGEMIERIEKRNLYKRSARIKIADLNFLDEPHRFEIEIANRLSLDPKFVILDVLPRRSFDLGKVTVLMKDGEIRKMSDLSPIASMLSHTKSREVRVYAPADLKERVGKAALAILCEDF